MSNDTESERKTMTKEEALSLVGDAVTDWFEYYKFEVKYSKTAEEFVAILVFGGDSDDVYRHELNPKSSENISEWIEDGYTCTIVRRSDGAEYHQVERYY